MLSRKAQARLGVVGGTVKRLIPKARVRLVAAGGFPERIAKELTLKVQAKLVVAGEIQELIAWESTHKVQAKLVAAGEILLEQMARAWGDHHSILEVVWNRRIPARLAVVAESLVRTVRD